MKSEIKRSSNLKFYIIISAILLTLLFTVYFNLSLSTKLSNQHKINTKNKENIENTDDNFTTPILKRRNALTPQEWKSLLLDKSLSQLFHEKTPKNLKASN